MSLWRAPSKTTGRGWATEGREEGKEGGREGGGERSMC